MCIAEVIRNQSELFERSFEVVGDLLGEHVGFGQIGGVFEALVLEPEDVEVHLVALRSAPRSRSTPAAVRVLLGDQVGLRV